MARLLVIGQSGTGKSWAHGSLIERCQDSDHPEFAGNRFHHAVHFDPEDEEIGLCEAGRPLFGTVRVSARDAERIDWQAVIAKHRYVRVVPDMREDEQRELYGAICQAVFRLCKDQRPDQSALISCDESGQIVTQNKAPDAALTVQTRGRKHGVETIHSAQRPQQLHTTVISQTDRRYYFRINDDRALSKLDRQAGFGVGRLPASATGEIIPDGAGLSDLPDRVVVAENVGSGDVLVQSTENWTRIRPHVAGDDGKLDDSLRV